MENYLKTHLFYIILIVAGVFAFRMWLSEHDARLQTDAALKQSEVKVQTLQTQITTTTATAVANVAKVRTIVLKASTPAQQIAAVSQLTEAPLNVRQAPSLPDGVVAVDLAPLVAELGQCKTDAINLGACTQNYNTCQAIVTEKDNEIVLLKKKPSFWKHITSHGKAAMVGMLIYEGIRIYLTHKP